MPGLDLPQRSQHTAFGAVPTGNGGRVLEPPPGRVIYIGTEIGYRTAAQP